MSATTASAPPESNALLDAALAYARRGWRIVPVHGIASDGGCACGKAVCDDIGKHPWLTGWTNAASNDEAKIREWLRQRPRSNIGVLTGRASGVFVLDKDGEEGARSLDALQMEHGLLPPTLTVTTGGGNQHFYFAYPADMTVPTNAGEIAPGIDLRGEGGQAVLPPSLHRSGRRYQWVDELDDIASAPAWLLEKIAQAKRTGGRTLTTGGAGDDGAPIPEGQRNDALAAIAGRMRWAGLTADELVDPLQRVNRERCQPPLLEGEVAAIAQSIGRYPAGDGAEDVATGSPRSGENPNYPNLRTEDFPSRDVPPFPLDVLPSTVRRFVVSATSAIGCPPDFTAVSLLGLAEGVAGRSRRIVIRPGFDVSPGSWYGVVGEPGTGKSPGQKYALRAVTPLQDEVWEGYLYRLERWEATPKDERGEKPQPEHFFITDSTGEALWASLASSSGVAQVEDELRRRLKALDAYRQAGDRQAMLALWANAPVKIVRRTSSPVYIPFPVAPLIGGIQPGVLRHLRGEGDDAEADDGWAPRFMIAWPDAEPLALSDIPFDASTLPPVVDVFRSLRRTGGPHDVKLASAAFAAFRSWHGDNRRAQMQSRGLERQWAAKAPIHLARLALVLHLFTCPEPDELLSSETMEAAIELLEYFRAHLSRVLPAFGASASAGTKTRITRILRTPKWRGEDGWVRRTDIGEALRNVSPDDMTVALEELLADGVVEQRVKLTATKPVELWRITEQDSQFTAREDSGYSGYLQHQATTVGGSALSERENPNNPNNLNGKHQEDVAVLPEGCGQPAICAKLGPCPHVTEHGRCWSDGDVV